MDKYLEYEEKNRYMFALQLLSAFQTLKSKGKWFGWHWGTVSGTKKFKDQIMAFFVIKEDK